MTMDIDLAVKQATFTKENVEKMIKEICSININDNAIIIYNDTSLIRQEDDYGGYRIFLTVKYENIRESLQLDIATGDPITPQPDNYKYFPLLGDYYIEMLSYNIETVVAEKLETILSRGEYNSRIRDYYDIYLIYVNWFEKINKNILKKAICETFKKRKYDDDVKEAFNVIQKSNILKTKWEHYSKKYKYAKDISYESIIKCIKLIVDLIIER